MNEETAARRAITSIPWTSVPAKTPGLVTRMVADETLVVPIKGQLAHMQVLYVLTPVANHLWTQMDGVKDLQALHASIVEAYDVAEDQARTDLLDFVQSMLDSGLIHLTAPGEVAIR
jgi:hypothetical protein